MSLPLSSRETPGRFRRFLDHVFGRNHPPAPAPAPEPGIPYSAAGSEPIAVPVDLVGRHAERVALTALLEERPVVFLHGPARLGKTYLAQQLVVVWRATGRPFLYTCPADQGIGVLFSRMGRFFRANGQEAFAAQAGQAEASDDDRTKLFGEQLTRDRYLVILDAFDQVAHRAPFRSLAQASCQENAAGRLLICTRQLPAWYGELPAAYVGEMALAGLSPEDIRALARQQGFTAADLEGLDRSLHPFVLQLLLFLSRQRRTTPAAILARMRPGELEDELLLEIHQGLEERPMLERLSVLRLSFQASAFPVFGLAEDRVRERPLSFLVCPASAGRYTVHPLVRRSGLARLHVDDAARHLAHQQALHYYQPSLSSPGKAQVQACAETANHFLERGQPRDALDLLARNSRAIVSFGYGWEMLALARRIEVAGLIDGSDQGEAAMALRDLAELDAEFDWAYVRGGPQDRQ